MGGVMLPRAAFMRELENALRLEAATKNAAHKGAAFAAAGDGALPWSPWAETYDYSSEAGCWAARS